MASELKACPFCGSSNVDERAWGGLDKQSNPTHGPGCSDCGALADSVEKWNRRRAPPRADCAAVTVEEIENVFLKALDESAPSGHGIQTLSQWDKYGIRAIHALLVARGADNDALIEKLKLEAQIHAQEARTQRATVLECYRIVTDGKGEPGDWNGAEPVRRAFEELRMRASPQPAREEVEERVSDEALREIIAATVPHNPPPCARCGKALVRSSWLDTHYLCPVKLERHGDPEDEHDRWNAPGYADATVNAMAQELRARRAGERGK